MTETKLIGLQRFYRRADIENCTRKTGRGGNII